MRRDIVRSGCQSVCARSNARILDIEYTFYKLHPTSLLLTTSHSSTLRPTFEHRTEDIAL